MTALDNATKFFHACENLKGWEGCKEYVADAATFTAQCEPLVDLKTVEGYCDWMAGVGSGPLNLKTAVGRPGATISRLPDRRWCAIFRYLSATSRSGG